MHNPTGAVMNATRSEYRTNSAFRLAVIGGVLMLVATAAGVVGAAVALKLPTAIILPGVFLLLINAAFVALSLYVNYCFEHGKCRALSLVHGALLLVYGIASVVLVLLSAVNLKGRK